MNKNSENYKNTYSALRPSDEAIERIFEMTTDKKKTGLRLTYRRIAAVVLAFVLIIGGGFGIEILTKNDSNKNEMLVSNGKKNDNYFVMSVYAAEGKPQVINNIDELELPSIKLKKTYDEEGNFGVEASCESLFSVSGKNISSVRYQCKNSVFQIFDFSLQQYLIQKGEYYDIIVPYTDEYKSAGGTDVDYSKLEQIMFDHIKNGDYDKYFKKVKKRDFSDYNSVEFVYNYKHEITGVGLLSNEKYDLVTPGIISKTGDIYRVMDYTFKNYLNETEHFAECYWKPNTAALFDKKTYSYSGVSFDELEGDTITVTVTFNDNSVQSESYGLSFNKEGELVIKKLNN